MKKFHLLFLGSLLSLQAFSAQADDTFIRDDINQIKEDIIVLQRQLYRDKNDTTAPQESVSTFQIKLGEYDQLIRDMNGKVENIEYRLNSLEKKMEMIDKDIELRFSQMKRQTAQPNSADSATKTKTTNASAKTLYETALTKLKDNKLADAEANLSQFLQSYPNDALAGNAQYWLGEVYYKQQNFAKAAIAFKDGYSKYPKGTKGPDCLLKLGLSMKSLGKKDEACTAFTNLPSMFNKVSTEISQRAQKEAEALACK